MASTATLERLITADEFAELPDDPDGRVRELLDGVVVTMSHAGEEHVLVAVNMRDALVPFVRRHQLGWVVSDAGFRIRQGPDRVVCPDLAIADPSLLPPGRDRTKAMPIAPSLAVEVKSPTNTERDLVSKVAEYLAAGSQRVWVVRPRPQTVTVYRPDGSVRVFRIGETLTSEDAGFAVEGFTLPVTDVFALE